VNVSRELTKLFQDSRTADIESLINYYSQNLPKGEIVLLVSGKKLYEPSDEEITAEIKNLLVLGKHAKDITQQLFQKYHKHYKKSKIYKICNSLK
jgi:16S rRNA (cytidine1402-2'-O)-methyltransferase